MTFKQLEQFLKTEQWRAGTEQESNMCGKYARCVYCDRFSDYPCARAYDTLMKKKREGKAVVSSWQYPEPDVKEKFGTCFACEDAVDAVARISINPEDLFFFSMGGRNMETYQPYYTKETDDTELYSYAQTALTLPTAMQERKYNAGRKRWKVGSIVPISSIGDNSTRVLVIRKRANDKSI